MDITWLDIWKFYGAALLAGCVIDWIVGGPVWLPHPVRLTETIIAETESQLRRRAKGTGRKGQSRAGVILAVFMYTVWWHASQAVVHGVEHLRLSRAWTVLLLAEGLLCGLMLAARGLYTENMKTCRSLEEGSAEEARYNVSMIVERGIAALNGDGITGAAAETMAENTSNGVIAPFLSTALLEPVGGTPYKAVNTMDSMVRYKSDKYMYFGRCVARLDDPLNLTPAGLTGALMVLEAQVLPGTDGTHAFKVFLWDRKRRASPNSAYGETACAGTPHLHLAGDAWYLGTLHKKPYIGDDNRQIQSVGIGRANRLTFFAGGMMVLDLAVLIMIL